MILTLLLPCNLIARTLDNYVFRAVAVASKRCTLHSTLSSLSSLFAPAIGYAEAQVALVEVLGTVRELTPRSLWPRDPRDLTLGSPLLAYHIFEVLSHVRGNQKPQDPSLSTRC